ncbi:proline dehydrogenase family protein [Microbacterium sp. BK668]|uniref:proline dehydrogenase family protein n=1 Tax=Microbacterium sp. BK668 TaxID=2512118 RepID=UPI00105C483B|nr:proline dehydrogenase family protein [Microbacterium sp. BK668]TDN92630.1 L-proline dehydrogenase [Microbacterium sp. BK668]
MEIDPRTAERAADLLRTWALDEDLKARVLSHPAQAAAAFRVAGRYIAGPRISDALRLVALNRQRGHRASVECVGESIRSAEVAETETAEFLALIGALQDSDETATVSFDLSHVGAIVDPDLGLENARRLAAAASEAGTALMVSAEGSARTDLVLDLYERIAADHPETGITLQARLHRTPPDLDRVMRLAGPVRIVKGAFLESPKVALARDTRELTDAYLSLVGTLVRRGHRVNIATHDAELVAALAAEHGDDLRADHVEFEMLQGLSDGLLDKLRDEGHATREYIVFGREWWLYVLNRIAEHPERVILALADLADFAHDADLDDELRSVTAIPAPRSDSMTT